MNKRQIKAEGKLLPFLILVLMLVVFAVTTRGSIFSGDNLMIILKQTMNTIIAALGMLFVAAMGATDITQGSLVGLAGACVTMTALSYGFVPAVLVALLCGLGSGLMLGVVNAKFKVQSFMVSLAMLIGLRALSNVVTGGSTSGISIPDSIKLLDNNAIKLPVVVLLILIVSYVFNKTPFGTYCRAIGENENAAKFAGIPVTRIKIIAFVLSGLLTSIASLFVLARVGGCSTTLGLGFEMQVMMAMFIGGVPVQGGDGTKLYKIILGAFTITVLENGLILTGSSGSITQLIRGIVLLAVVGLTIYLKNKIAEERPQAA